DYCCRLLF
nr:immunoglobulin light chain junction region [Macaca mulatta]